MTTARHQIPLVLPSQAQKHVTVNQAFDRMDVLLQLSVMSRSQTTPPGTPVDGDSFIVPAGGGGDWSGQDDAVAVFFEGAWVFHQPADGWVAHVIDEDKLCRFLSGWAPLPPTTTLDQLGINASADATNRLVVQSEAVILTHDGNHQRTTINKAASGDDATISYQVGYSPRALAGLLGDDSYAVKVSPDGSAYNAGFSVDPATGHVSLGGVADYSGSVTIHDSAAPELRLLTDTEDDVTIGFYDAQAAVSQNCKLIWSASSNTFSVVANGTPAFEVASSGTVSLPQVPVLSISRDANISWGANTSEQISFPVQRLLQGNIAVSGTGDVVTTPEAGAYLVNIRVATVNGTTGNGDAWKLELRQNGTNTVPSGANMFCPNESSGTGVESVFSMTLPVVAAANDTFEVWVTSINTNATLIGAGLEMIKIG